MGRSCNLSDCLALVSDLKFLWWAPKDAWFVSRLRNDRPWSSKVDCFQMTHRFCDKATYKLVENRHFYPLSYRYFKFKGVPLALDLWSYVSEELRYWFNYAARGIKFEVAQLMWSQYINVTRSHQTDRQTDRRHTLASPAHAVFGAVKNRTSLTVEQGFIQTFVSGLVWNSQGGRSSGRRPRVEARSTE